jgi:hypothetical protein
VPSTPPPNASRRRFLLSVATAAGGASLAALRVPCADAQAGAALPHLGEDDPLAKSLGYKSDASGVDKAKYPTFKSGQMCSLCRFFQGTAGQEFGPCQVFAGKSVSTKGWCVSFSAKT